jgi:hypothetical protein
MSTDERQVQDSLGGLIDHPGPEELQARVDAAEDDAAARYRRLQDYTCLLNEALRHADAMTRLELALRQPQVLQTR